MILVVTPNLSAGECVEAIRRSGNEEVIIAESLSKATSLLRMGTYLVVVIDQFLLETEATELDSVLKHLDTAILLQINLAICGPARLSREVRAAISRRKRELSLIHISGPRDSTSSRMPSSA